MKDMAKSRFRLLPYLALSKRWLAPALWLIPGGVVLWRTIPLVPQLDQRYAPAALVISGVGILIAIYALLARQAHVSCHNNRFVVHTPIYPLAFSYQRVEMVRPVEFRTIFPLENEKSARWRLYRNLWGQTVVVVTLKSYPVSVGWMRLWFHPYLLHPKERALVLPVDDWMGLSRRLESLRTTWSENLRQRRRR
jgi:extradiol dioxygenase family protein